MDRCQINILSVTPVVTKIGPIVSDKLVVAIFPVQFYNMMQEKLRYFAQGKKVYVIKPRDGSICMGMAADEISQTTSGSSNNTSARLPEKYAEKHY